MRLKFVTETETLFDKVMPKEINEKLEAKLLAFDDREIISLQMIFIDGTHVRETTDIGELDPKVIKEITITVK